MNKLSSSSLTLCAILVFYFERIREIWERHRADSSFLAVGVSVERETSDAREICRAFKDHLGGQNYLAGQPYCPHLCQRLGRGTTAALVHEELATAVEEYSKMFYQHYKFQAEKLPSIKFCMVTSGTLVFFLSVTWHSLKKNKRPPSILLPCPEESSCIEDDSCRGFKINFFKNVKLKRMLYDKPDTLKPPRSDVLLVTPWLAPIVWNGVFNRDILNAQFHQIDVRIGLTTFAIKKYVMFLKTFIETAEKFFMVGHNVTYYIFTDHDKDISNFILADGRKLVILKVPAYQRWQDVTMRRMEMIRDQAIKKFSKEVDYLVSVDIDMIFLEEVGVEILTDVFGTLHPGFFGASRREFTYERRPESAAYIPFDVGDFYYAGGNFGGVIEEVIRLTNFCHNAMLEDKQKNIEALWHDESYLNKYFLFYKPTKVLSPEYIWNNYYGSSKVIQKKRFLGIQKDYKEIRF